VRLDRVYEHARSAHERMHLKTIIDGAYVMAPCVFFVVSVYVMNEPSVVTLAIFGALAFVFVGETCHKISHFGFDEATTAVINSWPHEAQRAHVEPVHLEGGIELAAISFAHAKSSHPLFRDLSIKIDAKDYVLITGPSGSGKTSLLKIFAGAYSPYKGEILFDGQDARALNQTSLRMTFGVIFDNADIFVGSIYQNIMCQRPLAPKALERLLMSHEVFDVLLDLPMALQTYIIDRGKNISRLQRMAILLARALVHQPKFLFVDDIYGGLSLKDQHIVENFIASLSITRIITLPQAAPWMKPDKSIALPLDVRTAENS
jgi:ABC-type bacteriocin/lantibiotic exporter with double-glycine peptidase domain